MAVVDSSNTAYKTTLNDLSLEEAVQHADGIELSALYFVLKEGRDLHTHKSTSPIYNPVRIGLSNVRLTLKDLTGTPSPTPHCPEISGCYINQ